MDRIDEVIASGGFDSPLAEELSPSDRRRMHARILGIKPMGQRAGGGVLTGHEARRVAEQERIATAHEIGESWKREGNR